jgi:hypothetical protein
MRSHSARIVSIVHGQVFMTTHIIVFFRGVWVFELAQTRFLQDARELEHGLLERVHQVEFAVE